MRDKALYSICIIAGLLVVCWSGAAAARQNVLVGSIGTGYTFWEREYDDDSTGLNDDDQGDRREYAVWPEFEFTSTDIHNSLMLMYRPELIYDDIDSESDVDHFFDLNWEHQLSRQWSYEVANYFVYTNDPTAEEDPTVVTPEGEPPVGGVSPGDQLTENIGTSRYWTNRFALLTTYTYGPERNYDLGYSYRVLRDDSSDVGDGAYEEYDRHSFSMGWLHAYTPTWRNQLDLNYVRGLFDQPDENGLSQDLDEYRLDAELDYSLSANNYFPLLYSYQRVDYENLRNDVWGHELRFGWDYTIDQRNHFIVGAGPSYVDSDELDGTLGYNFIINYIRAYQHGSLDAIIEKRYLTREFTGGSDTGFTDATELRLDASYQLSRNMTLDGFLLYRYEEILNPEGSYREAALVGFDPALEDDIDDVTYTRDIYSLGVSASYDILRWLTASLGYVYYNREGDVIEDAYDDHRVVFRLVASTELWRQ